MIKLLSSDFLIVKLTKNNLGAAVSNSVNLQKNTVFAALNIFLLAKSLKQFIRSLQLLKAKAKSSQLNFYTKNFFIQNLLTKLLINSRFINIQICVENSFIALKPKKSKNIRVMSVILDLIFLKNLEKFPLHDVYLIHKINSIHEKNQYGAYKIFNNLIELKKILFFILLIKNVLSTHTR